MSGFDFTALITFLQMLFDAFMKLASTLGFSFGNKDGEGDDNADEGGDAA